MPTRKQACKCPFGENLQRKTDDLFGKAFCAAMKRRKEFKLMVGSDGTFDGPKKTSGGVTITAHIEQDHFKAKKYKFWLSCDSNGCHSNGAMGKCSEAHSLLVSRKYFKKVKKPAPDELQDEKKGAERKAPEPA